MTSSRRLHRVFQACTGPGQVGNIPAAAAAFYLLEESIAWQLLELQFI